MTPNEVAKVVYMLFTSYPQGDRQAPERAKIYERMLMDLDFEECQAGVCRLLQSSRFLPTIAEVREASCGVRTGLRRTGLEAWGDVTTAIRLVGSYRQPAFEDPLVARAVGALGWREVCLGDNESALRARFVEAYEAMTGRELREQAISESLRLPVATGGVRVPAHEHSKLEGSSDTAPLGTAGQHVRQLLANLGRERKVG